MQPSNKYDRRVIGRPVGHTHAILVVDDDSDILDMISDMLTPQGFTVRTAANGQRAFARALENLPDLILTDLMMPILDGRELLECVRGHPLTARIPVLLMSAAGSLRPNDTFNAFIAKPFLVQVLVAELQRHLV